MGCDHRVLEMSDRIRSHELCGGYYPDFSGRKPTSLSPRTGLCGLTMAGLTQGKRYP